MSREVHVRFCERPEVKFLRPTHPQITTVRDGKVWLFGVVEHWNAEALGWHVAKRGDRYAAVQAVGMAVRNVFGHVSPSAARGVALRHDHGSAFLAEHFHNQIRFWGMTPSYAFVVTAQPGSRMDCPRRVWWMA
jgi:hypothetical protein